jgi:H+-transporting ATPase
MIDLDSGWGWGLGVMAVSFLCLFLLDLVKVFVVHNWSFELTAKLWPSPAQLKKLKSVKLKKERDLRFKQSVSKVRKIVLAIIAIRLMKAKIKQKPASTAIQASVLVH